ncbi:MAG: alpha/beta hydrolase [Peptostreptococcaceae bacterium]
MESNIHKSFFREVVGSDTVVVFIHGILESPVQFHDLARISFKNNMSICGILLDGHGKTGIDFANSSLEKWMGSVEDEISKYVSRYENVILVGHSMGVLLSIDYYMNNKDKIKSIVAIATPLNIRVKGNIMRSSLKIALGVVKEEDELTRYAYDAFSIGKTSLSTYPRWIPRYLDLFKITNSVRNNLNEVDLPMLIFHCMNDELVSNRSINTYEKSFKYNNKSNNKKLIKLFNSGHFYYDEGDLRILEEEFENHIMSI